MLCKQIVLYPEHWPARQIDERRSRSRSLPILRAPLALPLTSKPESAARAPAREIFAALAERSRKINNYFTKLKLAVFSSFIWLATNKKELSNSFYCIFKRNYCVKSNFEHFSLKIDERRSRSRSFLSPRAALPLALISQFESGAPARARKNGSAARQCSGPKPQNRE